MGRKQVALHKRAIFSCMISIALWVSAPVNAESFLWEVQGSTHKVFLLGSMHLLPASAYPLPDAMESAYRQSDIVVFETDIATEAFAGIHVSPLVLAVVKVRRR